MTAAVTIGEFSRLTHLSVKALRHYHEIGLLEPAQVDPTTGYRRYGVAQVSTAQLIRRLRDLEMPLPGVFAVVAAPDPTVRDAAIRDHLRKMERELDRTRNVVASLRNLLEAGGLEVAVDHRWIADQTALLIRERVHRDDIEDWCGTSYGRLYGALAQAGVAPDGPAGATYAAEFFEHEIGEVVAFVPIQPSTPALSGWEPALLPGGHFAVGLHRGPYVECDRTYGAVGSHVAEHDHALPGPIREIYLVGPTDTPDTADLRAEVCWPIAA